MGGFWRRVLLGGAGMTAGGAMAFEYLRAKPAGHAEWKEDWDGRSKNGYGTRHLLLIRHGQYTVGDSDDQRGLTALGHTQAVATAARIKAMTQNTSNPVEITKLWHSNLRRSSSPTASRVA